MRILLATNNKAKVDRIRRLLSLLSIECVTPSDLGINSIDVHEGSDIVENARLKALAYQRFTDLPILSNDAAFMIDGEELDPAMVKRNALVGHDESKMSQDQIADAIIAFYRDLVVRRGGQVSACWEDAFALVLPDGEIRSVSAKRPVILTSEVRGKVNPYFPMRSMYIVVPTGKYVSEQTPEDEMFELRPLTKALERLFQIS